jgi:hypothetical protein
MFFAAARGAARASSTLSDRVNLHFFMERDAENGNAATTRRLRSGKVRSRRAKVRCIRVKYKTNQ